MGCSLCAKNYPEAFELHSKKAFVTNSGSTLNTLKLAKVIEDCIANAITYNDINAALPDSVPYDNPKV